jgi:hypothetical protein
MEINSYDLSLNPQLIITESKKKIRIISIILLLSGVLWLIIGISALNSIFQAIFLPLSSLYIITGLSGIKLAKHENLFHVNILKTCSILILFLNSTLLSYSGYLLCWHLSSLTSCEVNFCISKRVNDFIFAFFSLIMITSFSVMIFLTLCLLKHLKTYSRSFETVDFVSFGRI